ncbi:hypothetical protein SC8D11.04 [Streptomyces coelicolor A3(2)]|uniref:Uncharacterized protein n=1 Tax=Streptomyces coelicolor (strain ATCC BAA-471 / A3(2) / M145) TaxID=100226 RepID=Q9AK15_STRCO|nr:hypothetical protein SC8D11.04 [Streptomyces coelicolor A3(2)]
MRVVHPHQHAQQCGRPGQRQRDHGEPGPQDGEPDGQPGGQGGVVARKRPVPDARALRDRLGPGIERTAGTFLVHHEFQCLTSRVGHDGAEAGQHGPGDPSGVLAAHRRPRRPQQQRSEDHERALGGGFQSGRRP